MNDRITTEHQVRGRSQPEVLRVIADGEHLCEIFYARASLTVRMAPRPAIVEASESTRVLADDETTIVVKDGDEVTEYFVSSSEDPGQQILPRS